MSPYREPVKIPRTPKDSIFRRWLRKKRAEWQRDEVNYSLFGDLWLEIKRKRLGLRRRDGSSR